MDLAGTIAPLVGAALFGAIACISVRRAHRKAVDAVHRAGAAAE